MKNFFTKLPNMISTFFNELAQVRAASVAARMHRYDEAARLMAKK